MVHVFSKILRTNFADSCRQLTHPHTDSCLYAGVQGCTYVLYSALIMYTYVYGLSLLIKGRIPTIEDLKKTVRGILFSTQFLTILIGIHFYLFCLFGKFTNKFNMLNIVIGPTIISSVLSIFQERKVRRSLLALYVSQEGTNIIWNLLKSRGLVRPIPYGTTILFSLSTSLLLCYLKAGLHVNKSQEEKSRVDTVISLFRYVIGKNEEHDYLQQHYDEISSCKEESFPERPKKLLDRITAGYKRLIKCRERHNTCPHSYSCIHYILEGSMKSFLLGTGIQTVTNLVFNVPKIIRNPGYLSKLFLNRNFLSIPLTLMGFTGIFRSVCCLLRWLTGKDSTWHVMLAGLLAGSSYSQYNSRTIALYVLWKTIAIFYERGIHAGYMPKVPYGSEIQFSLFTFMIVIWIYIEPNSVRPGYFKTMNNLSGGRFAAMYRGRFKEMGLDSAKQLEIIMKKTKSQYGIKSLF